MNQQLKSIHKIQFDIFTILMIASVTTSSSAFTLSLILNMLNQYKVSIPLELCSLAIIINILAIIITVLFIIRGLIGKTNHETNLQQ